ncbi:MAG: hypothetical protein MJ054_01945 [Clostridia bacterium]|nr:hypothetical protein [Clostridia bacterium]
MKKLGKILTLVVAMALVLLTPSTPVIVSGVVKTTTASSSTYQFTAPKQSNSAFTSEAVDNYDLANWDKPTNSYLISQKLTLENNASFHETYPHTTLSNAEIGGRNPFVIATTTDNMPTRGAYSTSAITLPANGYYMVTVEYSLKEQDTVTNTTNKNAFGTFYLNDRAISLQQVGAWHSETFYIQTDILESASITPELYFGSRVEDALGAIYFDKFTVTAVNKSKFDNAVYNGTQFKIDPTHFINFSKADTKYKLVKSVANTSFTPKTNSKASSTEQIIVSNIPEYLGFNNERNYFFNKDGSTTASVMLMEADNSNISLNLNDYAFQAKPHEVYMFQFYSIATSDESFDSFYFTLTNEDTNAQTTEQVTTLTSYPYHNGWQLNTIFIIAGHDLNQSYRLGFTLANNDNVTGWVAIDGLKIYKVDEDYAQNNSSATGVHDTYDMNSSSENLGIANGYFELGTSNGRDQEYPLQAKEWTTNSNENGIINLDASLWKSNFGTEHPGLIPNYTSNNHVYMMHNSKNTLNTLTSPLITTTAGTNYYVSFDAYSKTTTQTKAWIVVDDEMIKLGNALDINASQWQHYEFSILQDEYTTSHSFYLLFEMNAIGYTYIDNVKVAESASNTNERQIIDLSKPLKIEKAWQATDENTVPYIMVTNDGLTIENNDGKKTIVENTFAYNLNQDSYYEFIITSRGKNAYLGLAGYDGLIQVTTDKENNTLTYSYKMYVKISDTTAPKLQITLGSTKDDEFNVSGTIFIEEIQVSKIEETEYNDAKELANTENSRILVLTPSQQQEETEENNDTTTTDNSFFGENWWYLIPTLITAISALLAIATFLFRKIKFEKHITKKHTSYARDMSLKNQQKKIVAQKAAKVDNVIDERQNN